MKKILMTFAAVLCCAMMTTAFTACSDDDEEKTSAIYTYGFSSVENGDLTEMYVIETAFTKAIGVSSSPFTYTDGESKLKATCQTVGKALDAQTFTGKYIFVVQKVSGTAVYSWSN